MTRLTVTAKKSRGRRKNDEGVPSDEEFRSMKSYSSFIVTRNDDSEENFEFKKGQTVAILPANLDPKGQHDLSVYWVANIKEVRGQTFDDGSNIVWTRVQWYYARTDAKDLVKSFDPEMAGTWERLLSDHEDKIESVSVEQVLQVRILNERDPNQSYIPPDTFYQRYQVDWKRRKITPKPASETCTNSCKRPYNPESTELGDLMHFCCRPSCRRAYHHSCLEDLGSKEGDQDAHTSPSGTFSNVENVFSHGMKTRGSKNASAGASTGGISAATAKIPTFSSVDSQEGDSIVVTRTARKRTGAVPLKRTRTRQTDEEEEVLNAILPSFSISGSQSQSQTEAAKIKTGLSERALKLLACSPDQDDGVDLEDLIPEIEGAKSEEPPKKKLRGRPAKSKSKSKSKPTVQIREKATLSDILRKLPSNLLTIATQPQIRGGVFKLGGVAGNVGMVTRARRLVYLALQTGAEAESLDELLEAWEEDVFGADWKEVGVGFKNAVFAGNKNGHADKKLPRFLCPECRRPI